MFEIAETDIRFFAGGDFDARVFRSNDRLYRAVRGPRADFYRRALSSGGLDGCGLVRTTVTDEVLRDWDLVLEHQQLETVTYCMEWSLAMWKDAALHVCGLADDLLAKGWSLGDCHPWNIAFDNTRPVFVDFGALSAEGGRWPKAEFLRWHILPMLLIAAGVSRIARTSLLAADNDAALTMGDVMRLVSLRRPLPEWLFTWYRVFNLRRAQGEARLEIASARKLIEELPEDVQPSEWTSYLGQDECLNEQDPKVRAVAQVLTRLRPRTVLDVGCNRGLFAELAARSGARVVAVDIDEPSIGSLYRRARDQSLAIHPIVMDLFEPTPAHGRAQSFAPAIERLRCDLVMALAVTHHLILRRGICFETIAAQLGLFSARWLLVEFVPSDDEYVRSWGGVPHAWYTLDRFIGALGKHFRSVDVMESSPLPRKLLLCAR